jgi:hypothetical protein
MKKFCLLLLLIALPLSADEIHLFDNTVRNVTITGVTDAGIEYTSSSGVNEKVSRGQVEKIIYTSGKEIEFYDKIFMKDGSVLKGRVIKKKDGYIEFNPAGEIPYDKIEISGIIKILYEGGATDLFTKTADADLIYFKDGKIIKGSRIVLNDKDVEYYDENNNRHFYGRKMIEKIIYKDGKTVYLDRTASGTAGKDTPGESKTGDSQVNSFIELELGWNGYAGAGLRFDYLLGRDFTLNGAAGVGLWGYRLSGALRYYLEYPYGLAFSLGAAVNTGGPLEVEMETQDSGGGIYTEKVEFDCKPVVCINGSILFSFQVNGNDRIYIETGYSYALQKKKYTYKTDSGRELTDESKDVMDFISPGGFMISAGYAVAF